jgi:hypothetical protein
VVDAVVSRQGLFTFAGQAQIISGETSRVEDKHPWDVYFGKVTVASERVLVFWAWC